MNARIMILLLIGVSFLFFGCAQKPPAEEGLTLDEARAIALESPCTDEGGLTGTYVYNENTATWWFDMDVEKEGCAPACVVDEETETAGINWRCTGLIVPEEEEQEQPTEEQETVEETTEEEITEETPTGNVSDEELADLFQIDTDEPLGDTGLDGAQTPSSEKEQNSS